MQNLPELLTIWLENLPGKKIENNTPQHELFHIGIIFAKCNKALLSKNHDVLFKFVDDMQQCLIPAYHQQFKNSALFEVLPYDEWAKHMECLK